MVFISLLSGLIFLLLHLTITLFNFQLLYKIDKIEHFIAGFLVSFFIWAFVNKYFIPIKSLASPDKSISWFRKGFIFFGTISIGFFWEIFEFLIDKFINEPMNIPFRAQIDNFDTMTDMIAVALGSLIFIILTIQKGNRKN